MPVGPGDTEIATKRRLSSAPATPPHATENPCAESIVRESLTARARRLSADVLVESASDRGLPCVLNLTIRHTLMPWCDSFANASASRTSSILRRRLRSLDLTLLVRKRPTRSALVSTRGDSRIQRLCFEYSRTSASRSGRAVRWSPLLSRSRDTRCAGCCCGDQSSANFARLHPAHTPEQRRLPLGWRAPARCATDQTTPPRRDRAPSSSAPLARTCT